jgi:hypothetical protein
MSGPSRQPRRDRSAAVGVSHADPGIADLLVMHHRVVERDFDTELGQVQFFDRGEQGVGRNYPVMLGSH